jgi:hypothetical protein
LFDLGSSIDFADIDVHQLLERKFGEVGPWTYGSGFG